MGELNIMQLNVSPTLHMFLTFNLPVQKRQLEGLVWLHVQKPIILEPNYAYSSTVLHSLPYDYERTAPMTISVKNARTFQQENFEIDTLIIKALVIKGTRSDTRATKILVDLVIKSIPLLQFSYKK